MWSIERVYTLPKKSIIDYFKTTRIIQSMYHVTDLEGMDDHERTHVFSAVPTPYSYLRHGMLNGGLLALVPDVENGFFGRSHKITPRAPITDDFGAIAALPDFLRLNTSHYNLFYYLQQINEQTGVPVMYYQSATSGGPPDNEVAVIFDGDMFVYQYDTKTQKHVQVIKNHNIEIKIAVLQAGLQHLGLSLPTHYFVLHTHTFNWNRYMIFSQWLK